MWTPLAAVKVPACGVLIRPGWKEAVVMSALMGQTTASAPTFDTSWTVSENASCARRGSPASGPTQLLPRGTRASTSVRHVAARSTSVVSMVYQRRRSVI